MPVIVALGTGLITTVADCPTIGVIQFIGPVFFTLIKVYTKVPNVPIGTVTVLTKDGAIELTVIGAPVTPLVVRVYVNSIGAVPLAAVKVIKGAAAS